MRPEYVNRHILLFQYEAHGHGSHLFAFAGPAEHFTLVGAKKQQVDAPAAQQGTGCQGNAFDVLAGNEKRLLHPKAVAGQPTFPA